MKHTCISFIFVDDVRHDVYLTLDHGVFNKGTKRADKNVEIDLEIIDEKEQIISVRISLLLNFLRDYILWYIMCMNLEGARNLGVL